MCSLTLLSGFLSWIMFENGMGRLPTASVPFQFLGLEWVAWTNFLTVVSKVLQTQ